MKMFMQAITQAVVIGTTACKSKPENRAPDNTAQNSRDKSEVPTADQAGPGKFDIDVT